MPGTGFFNPYTTDGNLPLTGTDYTLPNGVEWAYDVSQYGAPDAEGERYWESAQSSTPQAFKAGKEYTKRFNIGVFGPSLPSRALADSSRPGATRLRDTITADLPLFSDGGGNVGESDYTKATSSLSADGKEVFAVNAPLKGESYPVPAGKHVYKLAVDVSRTPAQSGVSTRVAAIWTFTSARVAGNTPKRLPLTAVRFTPSLTAAGTARAGSTLTVPFSFQGATTKAASLRKLAFAVSYDDGRTRRPAAQVRACSVSRIPYGRTRSETLPARGGVSGPGVGARRARRRWARTPASARSVRSTRPASRSRVRTVPGERPRAVAVQGMLPVRSHTVSRWRWSGVSGLGTVAAHPV
ncbi:hypothetical protein YUWDRAFT_06963 [Streptomyces sp. AmelKG-D3]|nr:hypothetical protein YUWDRAFT_06963 [Streptomyces sp. AmelKG-D3]